MVFSNERAQGTLQGDLKLAGVAAFSAFGAKWEGPGAASNSRFCLGAIVPVFQPDFDCGDPWFGGERNLGNQAGSTPLESL